MAQYSGLLIFLLFIIIIILIIIIIIQIVFVYVPINNIVRDAKMIVSSSTELVSKVDSAVEGAIETEKKIDMLIASIAKIEPTAVSTLVNINKFIADMQCVICSNPLLNRTGNKICTNGKIDINSATCRSDGSTSSINNLSATNCSCSTC